MNILCLMGVHKYKVEDIKLFRFETPYKNKVVRFIEFHKVCARCGASKYTEISYEDKDLHVERNYKETKE